MYQPLLAEEKGTEQSDVRLVRLIRNEAQLEPAGIDKERNTNTDRREEKRREANRVIAGQYIIFGQERDAT